MAAEALRVIPAGKRPSVAFLLQQQQLLLLLLHGTAARRISNN